MVVATGLSVGLVVVFPFMPPPVQVYVLAPFTVTEPVCWLTHIVLLVVVKVGGVFTVTVAVVLTVQTAAVPVIVYTCVAAGLAVTKLPVVALKPVAGVHANVFALLVAVNAKVVCPAHIGPLLTVSVGLPITFIVATAVFLQPLASVPVTV